MWIIKPNEENPNLIEQAVNTDSIALISYTKDNRTIVRYLDALIFNVCEENRVRELLEYIAEAPKSDYKTIDELTNILNVQFVLNNQGGNNVD